jgi:hypothetical protein
MGPEQARAQRLTDLCFLGAADFYFEGTAAADHLLLQARPTRKRPQPGQNTDENSLKQALTLRKCRKLPVGEKEERWGRRRKGARMNTEVRDCRKPRKNPNER